MRAPAPPDRPAAAGRHRRRPHRRSCNPPSRLPLPRLLPATGLAATIVAIGLGPAIHTLALPTTTAAAGMPLLQAGRACSLVPCS